TAGIRGSRFLPHLVDSPCIASAAGPSLAIARPRGRTSSAACWLDHDDRETPGRFARRSWKWRTPMHPSRLHPARFLVALALASFVSLPSMSRAAPVKDAIPHGAGGNTNPNVLPLGASAFGHSYGEWAERYWQWVLAQPTSSNPQLDGTGAFGGVGQSGPVW